MHTSVIGFPRIGAGRELKFACEKYFRKEIGATQLLETGEALRKAHWSAQKDAGIDYIPSNDFSFYDTVLDTAVLLNIVPRRYKELELSGLDRYFAMARGYQGERGDVRALAMRKWFNTNYHYIVPELDDDTAIELSGSKPWDEYAQAKALGMETKPVVIGPYTMLRLCRYTGKKAAADYAEAIAQAYRDVIGKCEENQVLWVQFDEPALVQDMGAEDMALFRRIYDTVLPAAKKSRVLLQTYFGDARDVYLDLVAMPFAGLGLDFVEGKETRRLIEEHGFPSDKLLFAGLVNGKNVVIKVRCGGIPSVPVHRTKKDLTAHQRGFHGTFAVIPGPDKAWNIRVKTAENLVFQHVGIRSPPIQFFHHQFNIVIAECAFQADFCMGISGFDQIGSDMVDVCKLLFHVFNMIIPFGITFCFQGYRKIAMGYRIEIGICRIPIYIQIGDRAVFLFQE